MAPLDQSEENLKKVYVSWNDVQRQVQELVRQMWQDR